MLRYVKKLGTYAVSLLGAAGTGLQNYVAVFALIKSMATGVTALTKTSLGLMHGVAILLGGVCSGLVNFFINVDLLENFMKRLTKKSMPKLSGWRKFSYWAGIAVFVTTGVLFGLTAFAFGSIGVLGAVSVVAGVFVALIMMIQELETWLERFDNPEVKKGSWWQQTKEWVRSLNKGKVFGIVIAMGNVLGLSLLFALGLTSFLTGVGVAAWPATIIGLTVAFTGGAFTEFYFYNRFLLSFCSKLHDNWQRFLASKYSPLGLVCGVINALVNGALSYVGISMLVPLLAAAGLAVPPVGVVIAVAVAASACVALASFILGMDFWERNSQRLPSLVTKQHYQADIKFELSDNIMAQKLGPSMQKAAASVPQLSIVKKQAIVTQPSIEAGVYYRPAFK